MQPKGYYYRDKDQAYMVDTAMVKQINKAIMHGTPIDTGGKILYPIFGSPSEKDIKAGKTRTPAWLIRPNSIPTLRWYWQIQEHKKAHTGCKPLGDGLCGFKMVRYFDWNTSTGKWELLPMVNHADSVQEKVLDSN